MCTEISKYSWSIFQFFLLKSSTIKKLRDHWKKIIQLLALKENPLAIFLSVKENAILKYSLTNNGVGLVVWAEKETTSAFYLIKAPMKGSYLWIMSWFSKSILKVLSLSPKDMFKVEQILSCPYAVSQERWN